MPLRSEGVGLPGRVLIWWIIDKFLARFFIDESSSDVSQEEYPSIILWPLAKKLRSLTLDEKITVFFAVYRLLQGRSDELDVVKLLVDCMINSDNGRSSTAWLSVLLSSCSAFTTSKLWYSPTLNCERCERQRCWALFDRRSNCLVVDQRERYGILRPNKMVGPILGVPLCIGSVGRNENSFPFFTSLDIIRLSHARSRLRTFFKLLWSVQHNFSCF